MSGVDVMVEGPNGEAQVPTIMVSLDEATDRQLFLAVYRSNLRMEALMADLTQAVLDIQAEVKVVADFMTTQVSTLQTALTASQTGEAADLAAAQTAADALEGSVGDLANIVTPPVTPPVDPPVDPTV
jgi:hypothetical protein